MRVHLCDETFQRWSDAMMSPSVVRHRLLTRDEPFPVRRRADRRMEFLQETTHRDVTFPKGSVVLVRDNTVTDEATRRIVTYTLRDENRNLVVELPFRTVEEWACDRMIRFVD